MKRREALLFGAGILAALAGCTSQSSTPEPSSNRRSPTPDPTPSPVTLQAQSIDSENPEISLSIAFNERTQSIIPTEPPTRAESGKKWLLVRMDVTNSGSESRSLTAHQYIVAADDTVYEYVAVDSGWAIGGPEHTSGPTVAPGETATGWVVFHVPADLQGGQLTVRENTRQAYAVQFTHNESLSTSPTDS